MSAQTHPLLAPTLTAAHGLDRPSPGEFRAGGRQGGPVAFHCRALALVVLVHGLALAACLASRSEAAVSLANRVSEGVTISLIPDRETAEPPSPPPAQREVRIMNTELANSEVMVQIAAEPPAAPRSEATATEPPAATSPQTAAPQAAAPPALPVRSEAKQAPREIHQLSCEVPKPEYPARSKRRGETGRVIMRIFVDEQGSVSRISLVRSSGYPALDQAALRAAQQARCAAYIENGQALAVSALQNFNFEWAE
ncbi:energy transducer TonB [Niveibacterium terrae]|uniref:energy transducer TonB n=1 Tax=Niveibacterium terrae TaxID=3373598 RepID=UPI003A8D15F2